MIAKELEIKDISRVPEFLDLLYGQVDRGIYVWGGNGEILDNMAHPEEWIRRHEADRKDEERAIALYHNHLANGMTQIRAFDCSGLVYWALHTMGLQKDDISSRGFYSVCKKISKSELMPGDLVFHSSGGRVVHVGVFVGGDKYIECKGRDVGVVCGTRKKNYWDKFGRYEKLKSDATIIIDPDINPQPLTITIKGRSVNVRSKPDTVESAIIGIAHKGETYEVIGLAANGWYNILFKGKNGYITNKSEYVEVAK